MEIQHPSHHRTLILSEDDSLIGLEYHGCGHRGPGPIYTCNKCTEIAPESIEHPLHPLHSLRLNGEWGNACQCCYHFCYFAYKCDECDYMLDPQCASLAPILKLQDPKHLLFLLDEVDFSSQLRCDACRVDFRIPRSNSPAFFCMIPRSAVEGGFSDGYYCDSCEELRDPKLPAYVCKEKECLYTAHVLPSLPEKYKSDLLESGASLDAFLHYFEAEVSRLGKQKEEKEAEREVKQQEIEALEDALAKYEASKQSE
ncbi:hypothetical protein CDL15_Pgr013461 [Punica granatum]|uniref:DC1 domain-containing protein n=1 Tax=Punica granatum TaxID=22663 RepID=A0A218W089_PUNGR|nr:hypothetical protein CDL15_Pgr013461 [Punica granatum]